MDSATIVKPLANRRGLSVIANNSNQVAQTPRRKLGNLSNTPLNTESKKFHNIDIGKPAAARSVNSLKQKKATLPVVYENVENMFPLTVKEFRDEAFPMCSAGLSEFEHVQSMPFDDDEDMAIKKLKPNISVADYLADIF